jgi:uncharacterized protein
MTDDISESQSYPSPTPPQPLSASDERTWAMLSHLSVLLNLFTLVLGPVAALVIYLVYRERSRYVAFHSLQSLIFQLVVWVGGGALASLAWAVSGALAAFLVGCALMPFALLLSLLPLIAPIYGVIGAIQTSQGQHFSYWLVGDWTRSLLTRA